MKNHVGALSISLLPLLMPLSHANIIFSQDFSSDPEGSVSPYIGSTFGHWDSINRNNFADLKVTGGALAYTRNGAGTGWFSRTTDFSPWPSAMIYSFDLSVSGNGVNQPSGAGAIWQVGYGFGTTGARESTAHSQFGISLTSTPGVYQFRDLNQQISSDFSGTKTITWVINNSGSTLSYLGPNNVAQTVPNDTWDLWAGDTRVFNDLPASSSTSMRLSDLKFVFDGGYGTITMDNFRIEDRVELVPELRLTGVVSVGFLILVIESRRRAKRGMRAET